MLEMNMEPGTYEMAAKMLDEHEKKDQQISVEVSF